MRSKRVFGRMARAPGAVAPPFFAAVADDSASGPPGTWRPAWRRDCDRSPARRPRCANCWQALGARPRRRHRAAVAGQPSVRGTAHAFQRPGRAGRSLACFSLPLEDMRHVARACSGTLNDVALAWSTAASSACWHRSGSGHGSRCRDVPGLAARARRSRGHDQAATLFVPLAEPRSAHCSACARSWRIPGPRRPSSATSPCGGARLRAAGVRAVVRLEHARPGGDDASGDHLTVSNVGAVDGPRYVGSCRLAAAYRCR